MKSDAGPAETAERLVAAATSRGMSVMARVDHAAAAETVGLKLGPTEVLMIGNPVAGTPLMQARQTAGIDLPLKALVWQEETGQTFVAYNDPQWIAARHGLTAESVIGRMTTVLAAIAREAAVAQGDSP
ncbi:MAG TPA: DUF302 domain-containing protein [Caulobacteraceae bacterium]|jgi:uncharacterized protein (DUF302 family)